MRRQLGYPEKSSRNGRLNFCLKPLPQTRRKGQYESGLTNGLARSEVTNAPDLLARGVQLFEAPDGHFTKMLFTVDIEPAVTV